MSNISELIEVIKKREGLRFDSEVATYMGIDRKSLAVAKSRKVIPISYINWYCKHYDIQRQKFEGHLKGSEIDNENEENMEYIVEAQRETIELQKEKIKRLEENNNQLKQNAYSVQSKKWDDLSCDFYSDVYVTFVPFKRVVKEMSGHGVIELSERLELSQDSLLKDYFSVGNWHEFNTHPVNDIIEPKTLKDLQGLSVQMPSLFESLKTLVGEHYFQQLITYKHKDKVVHTLCNIRIHWLNKPHRAECKTQFILGE